MFAERIVRTLRRGRPELGWWDHEAAIADGMANESDVGARWPTTWPATPPTSREAAPTWSPTDDWERAATRRGGERFTIELLARFALHEVVHHRVDAERRLAPDRPAELRLGRRPASGRPRRRRGSR